MKTEREIQNVIDWLGTEDADDPCDDLPFIENIRAFNAALEWVIGPSASSPNCDCGSICPKCDSALTVGSPGDDY